MLNHIIRGTPGNYKQPAYISLFRQRGDLPFSVLDHSRYNHYWCAISVVEVLNRLENLITSCLCTLHNPMVYIVVLYSSVYSHIAIVVLTAMFDSMSRCLCWQSVTSGESQRWLAVTTQPHAYSPEKFNIFNLCNAMDSMSCDSHRWVWNRFNLHLCFDFVCTLVAWFYKIVFCVNTPYELPMTAALGEKYNSFDNISSLCLHECGGAVSSVILSQLEWQKTCSGTSFRALLCDLSFTGVWPYLSLSETYICFVLSPWWLQLTAAELFVWRGGAFGLTWWPSWHTFMPIQCGRLLVLWEMDCSAGNSSGCNKVSAW